MRSAEVRWFPTLRSHFSRSHSPEDARSSSRPLRDDFGILSEPLGPRQQRSRSRITTNSAFPSFPLPTPPRSSKSLPKGVPSRPRSTPRGSRGSPRSSQEALGDAPEPPKSLPESHFTRNHSPEDTQSHSRTLHEAPRSHSGSILACFRSHWGLKNHRIP